MYRFAAPVFLLFAVVLFLNAQQPASESAALREAIHSLTKQAQRWIENSDAKSVQRITSHLTIVADLWAARADTPEWQKSVEPLRTSIKNFDTAVRKGTGAGTLRDESLKKLEEVRKSADVLAAVVPTGKPSPAKAPAGNIKNFMYLLDSMLFEARSAAEEGNLRSARLHVDALTELSGPLRVSRKTEEWAKLTTSFVEETKKVSQSTTQNSNEFRQLLISIRATCEDCHDKH